MATNRRLSDTIREGRTAWKKEMRALIDAATAIHGKPSADGLAERTNKVLESWGSEQRVTLTDVRHWRSTGDKRVALRVPTPFIGLAFNVMIAKLAGFEGAKEIKVARRLCNLLGIHYFPPDTLGNKFDQAELDCLLALKTGGLAEEEFVQIGKNPMIASAVVAAIKQKLKQISEALGE